MAHVPPTQREGPDAKQYMQTGFKGGFQRLKNVLFGRTGKVEKAAAPPASSAKVSKVSRLLSAFGIKSKAKMSNHKVSKGPDIENEQLETLISVRKGALQQVLLIGNEKALADLCKKLGQKELPLAKILAEPIYEGQNILDLACRYGRADVVSTLLDQASDSDTPLIVPGDNKAHTTALHRMCINRFLTDDQRIAILQAYDNFASQNPSERAKIFSIRDEEGCTFLKRLAQTTAPNSDAYRKACRIIERLIYS